MKNNQNCKYEVKRTIGHRIDGTPIRKSFYGKSKREAKQKADDYLIEHGKQKLDGSLKFKDLYEMFRLHHDPLVRDNTRMQYESRARLFLPVFGNLRVDSVTKLKLSEFANSMSEKYSEVYIRNTLAVLRTIFSFAVDNGMIATNPCSRIKYNAKKKSGKKSTYTQEETDLILKYIEDHLDIVSLSVHIMLSYGTTISETCGIRFEDIDFKEATIHIQRSVTKAYSKVNIEDPKNPYRKRVMAVSKKTLDLISRTCDRSFDFIIHDAKDKSAPFDPMNWRYRYKAFMNEMQAFYLKQGIEIPVLNPHELRHTRATLWVEQDVNLFAIAEQMGWSNLEMLKKVYGHPDISKLRKMLRIE